MSTDNFSNKSDLNKNKVETDATTLSGDYNTVKTMHIPPDKAIIDDSKCNEAHNQEFEDEALKTLEILRQNLNTNCNGNESPETSDCEFYDDYNRYNHEMIDSAHFLGYTACIQETFRFLDVCGISESDPIYEQLKKHFIESSNRM